MQMIKKLFTDTKMSWKRVLVLSLVCGVVPGLLMVPDVLEGTSFRQPGISFEFWIFTALLIILNCEKPLEAGIKTFVFFLISQPLIYLVQVPFSWMHWQLFSYYPRWGLITLLTLPGGMLAWYVKKGNFLSVLILSVAELILCFHLPALARPMLSSFPHCLLSVLFTLAEIILFPCIVFENKKLRLSALAIAAAMLIAFSAREVISAASMRGEFSTELEGAAPFTVLFAPSDAEVTVDGNTLTVKVDCYNSFPIELTDANGESINVQFAFSADGAKWTVLP